MKKPTPGPRKVETMEYESNGRPFTRVTVCGRRGSICRVTGRTSYDTTEKKLANGYLISSVHDSLKACYGLIKAERFFGNKCLLCEGFRNSEELIEHGSFCPVVLARAAIIKAENKEALT